MSNSSNPLGYELFTGMWEDVPLLEKVTINTLNQYSFCMAYTDASFEKALQASDILLPDGIGIVVAERILTGKKIKKISGSTLHAYLLKSLNEKSGKCFYLGSSESTLKKIQDRVAREYPAITVKYYAPPYKSIFSDQENTKMLNEINDFSPDVLFIGMTAPKQEKWAIHFKDKINAKFICSVGAVFDFYAGTIQRPKKIWINLGLEWLGRFISEPKRLWKRYFYYGPIFIYIIIKKRVLISSLHKRLVNNH